MEPQAYHDGMPRPADWWNAYNGIAYTPKGRSRAGGLDCWGLVRLVHAEQFGIELPSLADGYEADDFSGQGELIALEREGWERVDVPRPGDVVLFRILGEGWHLGVAAAPGYFLHVREGSDSVIERLDSGAWKHRLEGIYRYRAGAAPITVAACPHPLRTQRVDLQVPPGTALVEIVGQIRRDVPAELGDEGVVFLDGELIPREAWERTLPRPGARIEYRAVARGNGVGRLIGMIVVAFVAWYAAPMLAGAGAYGAAGYTALGGATMGTAIASAAINFAGGLLLNAIFPTRPPKTSSPGSADPTYALQGGNNQAAPYGAIPVVLGRMRYTPPLGAKPYVEAQASKSYLRTMLCWGYGPLQISDMRIGETPVSDLEEVEVETLDGWDDDAAAVERFDALYGVDVDQLQVGVELDTVREKITSATRASGVITVVTDEAHEYAVGELVDLYDSGNLILASGEIASLPTAQSFTFAHAGIDEALLADYAVASGWTERTMAESVDRLTVTLDFPQGLYKMDDTGERINAICNVDIDIRLVGGGSWEGVAETIRATTFTLPTAYYNTDADATLEAVYQWSRVAVDTVGNIVVRHGCYTAQKNDEPSGTLLARLQADNFGTGATFSRLPRLGDGETEIFQVCIKGNSWVEYNDFRAGLVTGCALSHSGRVVSIAAGTISRTNTIVYLKRRTMTAFSHAVSFHVPKGIYEVRCRRTNNVKAPYRGDKCVLSTITGYTNNRPINPPAALARSAFRILATNQLNGNIEGIVGTVISICKDWDATTGTWIERPTRNPASLFRWVLQHPANARAVADAQIVLADLADWHAFCVTNGFTFDAVLTGQQSILDVLRDIAAAGRASPTMRDGAWTVIIDRPRSVIAQHFTPHNSWGFEGVRALTRLPHGWRVAFANAERGFQPDERIVYADGYDVNNATLLEGLTLPGVTVPAAIHKHARMHFAQLKLRPETYTLNADFEHLVCTRGDLVKVTHDVPMWGLGTGRIRQRIDATHLELDETVPMDGGVQYTIRIRLEDGSSITRTAAAAMADGHYSTITLTAAVSETEGEAGNLWMFGALNAESVDLVVLAVEPAENMSARLTLVDYSPAIYDSDSEAVPAFSSQITLPPTLLQPGIAVAPTITEMISDERVMTRLSPGVFAYGIRAAFSVPASLPSRVTHVQGQIDWAEDNTDNWSSTGTVPIAQRSVLFGDVEEGETYRLRLRYVDDQGRAGPWSAISTHVVVGKTNPPLQVGAGTATVEGLLMRLDWPDNAEPDVSHYEVRSADSGWGGASPVFRGAASTCTALPPVAGASATWYVKAVDVVGNFSTLARSINFTAAAVPQPGAISHSFYDTSTTSATITLDWSDVAPQFGLSHYEVSYPGAVKTVKASSIVLPANWLGDRTFSVVTVDLRGNRSAARSATVTKLAPDAPTGVRADVIDNTVMLYWTLPAATTLPVSHALLKKGASWAAGAVVGRKDGAFTTINELQAGTYTYWVAAVDTDGNESAPVSVAAKVSEPPDFVFHGSQNSAFAGTLTSALLEQGAVVLPVDTAETIAQHFDTRSWASAQAQIDAGFPIFIQPTPGSGSYRETFDFGTLLASSRVTVSWSGAVVAGSPVIAPKIELSDDNATWQTFDGVAEAYGTNFRYVRVTLTVTGTNAALYQLLALNCRSDAKLKTDGGTVSAVAGDASGTVVNFSKDFIDVQAITVSPGGTVPLKAVWDYQDAVVSGTYSVSSNVVTVNATAHGLVVGQKVRLNTTSGTAAPATVTVASVPTANQFTASLVTANTSGNLGIYPQGMRIYLFDQAGSRASGPVSWSLKGY